MGGERTSNRSVRVAHRSFVLRLAAVVVGACLLGAHGAASANAFVPVNGTGSTIVGLALQQWTAEAQQAEVWVNYTPTTSPDGLARFDGGQVDFAATEIAFASLPLVPERGYQYLPAVASPISVVVNVADDADREFTSLHLPPRTIARIFLGDIERWSHPAIAEANPAVTLPDEPITVVYPAETSGVTGAFFDFVADAAPDLFGPWASEHGFPTEVPIIDLDRDPTFVPRSRAIAGPDALAQHVASPDGRWSIGYVPAGYAAAYGAHVTSTTNGSGAVVTPSAGGVTSALRGARQLEDTSLDLAGVHASSEPTAYPIAMVHVLVVPCQPTDGVPTCAGGNDHLDRAPTLATFVRLVVCEGQATMEQLGYARLPENLSQLSVDGIPRISGSDEAPEVLTAATCANPAFVDPLTTTTTTTTASTTTAAPGSADTAGPVPALAPAPVADVVVATPRLAG